MATEDVIWEVRYTWLEGGKTHQRLVAEGRMRAPEDAEDHLAPVRAALAAAERALGPVRLD